MKREAFPATEDPEAVQRNAMYEEHIRRKNEGDARNLAYVTRNIDINMAKMRGDVVFEVDRYGNQHWL